MELNALTFLAECLAARAAKAHSAAVGASPLPGAVLANELRSELQLEAPLEAASPLDHVRKLQAAGYALLGEDVIL